MLNNLKTSKKVSIYFSIFSFISLIILLLWVNIIYFSIWYNWQKNECLYDMNMSYSSYSKDWMDKTNIESFKDYILTKDSIIITNSWEKIVSDWFLKKVDWNIENKVLYKNEDRIYLIFSRNYSEIWNVKILFDTTDYINSQLIIIKISLLIILFSVILNYFLWELTVKKSLKNLNIIKEYCQNLDIDNKIKSLEIEWSDDDEIKIVAEKLSSALKKIKSQNDNLKQFIADISHEFKTPLMALNSKNDLINIMIEKQKATNDDIKNFLEYNKYYIKKLDKILEILILITRLKEKNVKLNFEEINLKKHIEKLIIEKDTSKIKILWEKLLKVDIATFDIIIENLINNSIKYWNDKEIIINLQENYISIKDNWIWIKKENLEKLFDNFFQENHENDGFWIWLYLVKRILDLYNWKIEVKSEVWIWSEFIIYY